MTPEDVEALFTRESGEYAFARWGRPLAPVVFGVDDASLDIVKGAIQAVCHVSGASIAETDPELGSNFIWFFFRDWSELLGVSGMDRLVPDLEALVGRLESFGANQYRFFRFDEAGAIKACFVFLRMDGQLQDVSADTLALNQAVQSFLLWSDVAFRDRSPLAVVDDKTVLRPEIAAIIRAAYDPVMPAAAQDNSHALRLAARIT